MTAVFRFVFTIVITCALFFSCTRGRNALIDLPATPILTSATSYAVIINPYIPIRDKPQSDGVTVRHLRNGDIEEVIGRQSILSANKKNRVVWLKLSDGWIPDANAHVYTSREKAETAAEKLLK